MGLKVKDIAGMLKVSPATVSLVLNNKPGISEETRRRILKAVEDLGYSTNMLSKPALKSQGSIRFIVYKKHGNVVSDTPFFSALMEGIDQEARMDGYNLIISYINELENNKMDVLRILEDNAPSGILLLATEMKPEDLEPFKKLNIPLVILDSYFDMEKLDTVIINNINGAYQATRYLIDCGHQEIGYLHSSVWINNFDERQEGFFKALSEHYIRPNKKYILMLESTMEGSYKDMNRILQSKPALPTAFFADNDIIAFGAVKALKENGYRIPEDISVIGFDDMPFCEMIDPPLTTLRVYKQRMGMIAVKRLLEKIEKNTREFVKIEVGTDIIERKSVLKK